MDKNLPVSAHHIRLSLIPVSVRIVGGIFLIDTVYALVLLVLASFSVGSTYVSQVFIGLLLLHVLNFLFEVGLVLQTVLEWATTTYYINDEHLIRRSGVVRFQEDVYSLHSIRFVNVEEHWLSKMLNYGSVQLTFGMAGYREHVKLKGIVNPKKYEQLFRSYLHPDAQDYPADDVPLKTVAGATN